MYVTRISRYIQRSVLCVVSRNLLHVDTGAILYIANTATHYIQSDQKVSVHLVITTQKVKSNVQCVPPSLRNFIDTRFTLTPSVILNSNYAIMVSD
jgi:hypothetical protein